MIDHGLNVAEAENAPRAHDQLFPDELRIERGMSPDTIRLLEAMGHKVVVREAMGSANTIVRLPDGELTGASDLRQRGTLAVGIDPCRPASWTARPPGSVSRHRRLTPLPMSEWP